MRNLARQQADIGPERREVVYVSKFSPSQSGVALYADTFCRVLGAFGRVQPVKAPAEPHVAQRFRSALRAMSLAARGIPTSVSLVHVELSGRSLFEFYFAIGTLLRRRRPLVVVTCHDVPALVGPPMLFAALDRRGLRRLGMTLSRVFGNRLEAWLLASADALVTLTEEGAAALERSTGRRVHVLPHVVAPRPAPTEKEQLIFVPGYVDDAEGIASVARAVSAATLQDPWRVAVGVCSDKTRASIRGALEGDQAANVVFLGLLNEMDLFGVYRRARFVVRFRAHVGANRLAASSPLIHALAAGCMCVTDDDRAGARELERLDLLIRTHEPARRVQQLLVDHDQWRSPEELVRGIQAYSGLGVIISRYTALLRDLGLSLSPAAGIADPVS